MGGPSEEPESAFKEPIVLESKKGKGKAGTGVVKCPILGILDITL